ncbi:MAG: hypothetical protein WBW04_14880 [Nitrolancea sp.]
MRHAISSLPIVPMRSDVCQAGHVEDSPGTRGLQIAMLIAGSAGTLVVGVVLTVTQGSPIWLVLAVAASIVNVVLVSISRRRLDPDGTGEATGRMLTPPPLAPPAMATINGLRRVGVANVPTSLGRMNYPLAVLELDGERVTIRLRPASILGFLGVSALELGATTDVDAFPVRGRLGASGIGLKPPRQPVHYFWTGQRETILAALTRAGISASWQERRPAY